MGDSSRKILALIPARGSSKGIIKKNIRSFAGKPLIAHSIEAAKGAPSVHRTVVSTDSEEIAVISRQFGAEVPFLRPSELATSSSKVIDAVEHALKTLRETEGYSPSHVLLLQPTSPLRTSEDINNAVALFEKHKADSLVSVCRTENVLMTKDVSEVLSVVNGNMLSSPNRQELPNYFKFDGSMIYLVDANKLMKERSWMVGKCIAYEIARWRAVDLDEPQDFILGELIYNHKDQIEHDIDNFI